MEMLNLLIVDDEVGMGLAVQRALRDYTIRVREIEIDVGFRVDHTETGERALEIINSSPPDILLLDHKLPGVSGLDILSHLAEHQYDLLTVMITAYASLENAILATKRGAYDFLAKPFTPDELKSSVYRTAKHLMLQRQARRLSREKRQVRFEFISVLAHELKAPLAAVEQYLSILDGDLGTGTEKQMVERSLSRIRGMRKLILDLLDLTRIESGQRKREVKLLNLKELAAACIESFQVEAEGRGIGIALHVSQEPTLMGDRWEIETILNNLISNGIKYNRDGGRVDVRIAANPEQVKIAVSDTGIGISEEEAKGLFREFGRIRNDATESIAGSGLGLSTVKKIAALYKGDVALIGTQGEGSTFEVTLAGADMCEPTER